MKDLVNAQVNDALAKRKEQVKYKKELQSDGSGQGSNKNATNQVATTFYEKKIEDFENKFAERDREVQDLRQELGVVKAKEAQRLSERNEARDEAQEKYKKILELKDEIEKLRKQVEDQRSMTSKEIQEREAQYLSKLEKQQKERDEENQRLRESIELANESKRKLKEEKEQALRDAMEAQTEIKT